jgi:hypothetical protein
VLGIVVFRDSVHVSPGIIALQAAGLIALLIGVIMVARAPALARLRRLHPPHRDTAGHAAHHDTAGLAAQHDTAPIAEGGQAEPGHPHPGGGLSHPLP